MDAIKTVYYALIWAAILVSCSDNSTSYSVVDKPKITRPDSLPQATVLCAYVSDGDTWNYYFDNVKYPVRVLNIDCFETTDNERLTAQAKKAKISNDSALVLGHKAKVLADSLLKNKNVVIERDISAPSLDVYNRLLRHCYIDGKRYDSIIKARRLDANTF